MDFPTNRRSPLFLSLILGLSLTAAGCGEQPETETGAGAGAPEEQGEVVATVNGEPITEAELEAYQRNRPSSAQMQNREGLLDELITREVVYQDALSKGLDEDPEVLRELEQMRTRALVSAAVRKAMEENPVEEEQLRAEYDKMKERTANAEYKARHILVDEEDEAKALIEQLDGGADFAELAREHSTGPTGNKGGDLGWFNPQQMVPEFSEALQELEKGDYTSEPVKTQFGWHVIKLEDTRQSEPPSFEQVRPQLEQMAQQRKVSEYIEQLKDSAEISVEEEAEADTSGEQPAPAAEEEADTATEEESDTSEER